MAHFTYYRRGFDVPVQQTAHEELGCDTLALPPGLLEGQYQPSPKQPPPGLASMASVDHACRPASPVSPEPLVVLTNRDISLFSHLAPFIDEDDVPRATDPRVDLDCTICGDYKLEMPEHASLFSPADGGLFNTEPFTVAPCGHLFGYHCLSSWVWEKIKNALVPSCPVCRFRFVYRDCGHLIRMRPYNVRVDRICQLPRTTPEGGEVPANCEDCEAEVFGEELERIGRLIYPQQSGNPCLDGKTDGPTRSEQLRQELRVTLLKLYRENKDRGLQW